MHKLNSYLSIAVLFCLLLSCGEKQPPRVLVFSKTTGYRHESIGTGKIALMELGKKNGFEVDTTENSALFNEENLKRYRAVIFLSTTQDVLDPVQQVDFKRFIEAGGGYVGIHAAADTEYEWPWYGKLVGAYFKSHPKQQEAMFRKVEDFGPHPNTLPKEWKRFDELYNYKHISPDIKVIYNLDESTYTGGENGENHPIAWYHEFEGGRSFYTGMGHTNESYSDSLFLDHLLTGINYAIGDKAPDYSKAKSVRAVEENRFTKTVLDFNLDEPTEMAVLPDGKVLFLERKGEVVLYTPADGKLTTVNKFNVWTKSEDGMIGLAADPNFAENHWLYIFYSHPDKSVNVLSRFEFKDDKVDMTTEKQLLEVATQRETCCHTGGSLLFDANGNLFISTGDNTSPFASDGFSPSDETPGRAPFDAQKSSGNTNDLRGKILRIHPEKDGTYTIPEGNLFAKGEEKTRPEIYVMGCRNPYRISLDAKTGYLYWGEVGPDAGKDDSLRGPRGYDELNQAKKPGYFGWPYFVGNNFPYAKYDFVNKKVLAKWDPAAPINESPNNTGKRELPPVSPALIWYPYAKSDDFPMVKEGGRNAMAGPVYYSENYKGVATAFPTYFDGKLLIYDWIRNWMFLVTMDASGAILDMEPFMPHTKFNNIIDMAYGPDGKLYMIEYGTAWFKQNLDARLVRIDYNGGNRPPVAVLATDKIATSVPATIQFTTEGTNDPDGDAITYQLEAEGKTLTSTDGKFSVDFKNPGAQTVKLTVKDDKGGTADAQLKLTLGNEMPVVKAEILSGNKDFYFPGTPVKYAVTVTDKEDGSTTDGKIKGEAVTVTFDYLKGFDITEIAQGHQVPTAELPGKALIEKSDCKSCHIINQKSAGPSYKDVAEKYKGDEKALGMLASKVIKGGAGVWGTIEMAAHPQVSVDDAKKMVEYILSLAEEKNVVKLPLTGTATPGKEQDGAYMLTATYFDKGASGVPSLSGSTAVVLRSPMLTVDQMEDVSIAGKLKADKGQWVLQNVLNNAHGAFKNIDLTGVKKATLIAYILAEQTVGGEIELHLDKPDGKLLGKVNITAPLMSKVSVKFAPENGRHDLYVVFKNATSNKPMFYFSGVQLDNK
ncbi:ThuA domain-containing protein [Chryseolinea lacunae]|uniref:ThuA domain-containing protein n=1 Tax=Chryseolinea lacunae TaxID=2801331 RepID=A0ABS1KW20_9BACT|nr:ThuA domain-containing protein [Chryseolinea lacunae]MBL0743650.1 ThuA domain-containing protein [Chryseolinea lacunae]